MTAAVSADAALDVVRSAEIELTGVVIPESSALVKLSYNRLVELMFNADSTAQDGRPKLVSHVSIRRPRFDRFVYVQVTRSLTKFEAFRTEAVSEISRLCLEEALLTVLVSPHGSCS